MREDQVRLALSFIDEPDSIVVIQAPTYRDLKLVKQIMIKYIGQPEIVYQHKWQYSNNRVIVFEVATREMAGMGYNCPIILVERLDGWLPREITHI